MAKRLPAELQYSGVYVTPADLGFLEQQTEANIAVLLQELSAYDCLGMIGRLSSAILLSGWSLDRQVALAQWLTGFDQEWLQRAQRALRTGRIMVFEQQLTHLARLVIRYAADRPPDDFSGDDGRRSFLRCLFGVSDLLADSSVDLRDHDQRLSWALRHTFAGQHTEPETQWSTYYEIFRELWPQYASEPGMPDASAAFERYTGTTIQRFMSTGLACTSAFLVERDEGQRLSHLNAAEYFGNSELPERDWRAFIHTCSATLSELRAALESEEQRYGSTTFGALAFERSPLVRAADDNLYLVSLAALSRRATEGILHILAEGAEAEGRAREGYTTPFGKVFERWAGECFVRAQNHVHPAPGLILDEEYGPKKQRRRTPDVVLKYPRVVVLVEVVSGPIRAATVTHGDLASFNQDLEKLIEKKARQLTSRAREIMAGEARGLGLDPDEINAIYPVIVTSTALPQRPEIARFIRKRLRDKNLLTDKPVRVVAILSAEELAACEGAMEEGHQFIDLLREWKADRSLRDHGFKNHLIAREKTRRRLPATHHRETHDRAVKAFTREMLGGGPG